MGMFKDKLQHVKAFIFDVDGVFTNGFIFVSADGTQTRSMNVKDGYAVHYAVKKGFPIGIISGGKCQSIVHRFNDLGVTDIYLTSYDKMLDFDNFILKYNLSEKDVFYIGDDLPDYNVMKRSGLCACPADATHEIQVISDFISSKGGGQGCVREIIEQTLRAQNKWMDKDAFVW
jgi:3-deoxy-D-manno-octulosonate 8-phosphate phosphatase (KDO 8-P phosphatase)